MNSDTLVGCIRQSQDAHRIEIMQLTVQHVNRLVCRDAPKIRILHALKQLEQQIKNLNGG